MLPVAFNECHEGKGLCLDFRSSGLGCEQPFCPHPRAQQVKRCWRRHKGERTANQKHGFQDGPEDLRVSLVFLGVSSREFEGWP